MPCGTFCLKVESSVVWDQFSICMIVTCLIWLQLISVITESVNVHQYLIWRFCLGSASLFQSCYALAPEENMAASLQVLYVECYNGDVLVGWTAWVIGSFEPSYMLIVLSRFQSHSCRRKIYFCWVDVDRQVVPISNRFEMFPVLWSFELGKLGINVPIWILHVNCVPTLSRNKCKHTDFEQE